MDIIRFAISFKYDELNTYRISSFCGGSCCDRSNVAKAMKNRTIDARPFISLGNGVLMWAS